MSELTDAMIMHIHHLVYEEHRPFSYVDFIKFEVNEIEYKMSHGTFRNKISRLIKEGLVEVSYRSNTTFYTLRGIKFNNASGVTVTGNHTGVPIISSTPALPSPLSSNPLYRIIRDLPLDKNSIHDIRLRFLSPQIYTIASSLISENALSYDYTLNSKSKDILLPVWKFRSLLIKVTIHRTNTVSVMIGCSLNPIALDINGIIHLTNALSIVEEKLSRIVEEARRLKGFSLIGDSDGSSGVGCRHVSIIPFHSEWTVTMWHFGADASVEYSGERFCVTWETAENVLIRAYSKELSDSKRTRRIRLERQEYPDNTLADLIEQRINRNQSSGG